MGIICLRLMRGAKWECSPRNEISGQMQNTIDRCEDEKEGRSFAKLRLRFLKAKGERMGEGGGMRALRVQKRRLC